MEVPEQVNGLLKRVEALEAWKESLEKHSPPFPVTTLSNGSREAWVLAKKMEAKERMAKEMRDRHCAEVAFGPQWDEEGIKEDYVRLRKEIRVLNEKLAAL